MLDDDIAQWLLSVIPQVKISGESHDIHLDELVVNYPSGDKEQIFNICCQVINSAARILPNIEHNGIGVFLVVSFVDSDTFTGTPKNVVELVELIDTFSVPEIVVYLPDASTKIPLSEFYRSPLPFELTGLNDNLVALYKEYKLIEGYHPDCEFTRDLNIVYQA
jgi:hypothetical protein